MLNNVLLVAAREIRQIMMSRGFIVSALLLPVLLAIGLATDSNDTAVSAPARLAVVDHGSGAVTKIRTLLSDDPSIALLGYSESHAPSGSSQADTVRELLKGGKADAVLFLERTSKSTEPVAQLWFADRVDQRVTALVGEVLATLERDQLLRQAGIKPNRVAKVDEQGLRVRVMDSSHADHAAGGSPLSLGIAYLLLFSLLLSGAWLLQSLVEERSNKLLEAVLSCVSAETLFRGKLLGGVIVGLALAGIWSLCAIAAAFMANGPIAQTIHSALLAPIGAVAALAAAYFFLTGFVIVALLFLTIGAMSDSVREAQSYLTPTILLVTMPFALMGKTLAQGAGGFGVALMTWIPIYTPLTMLVKLGVGSVPIWQIAAAALSVAAFLAVEMIALGRVFRASILHGGGLLDPSSILQAIIRKQELK